MASHECIQQMFDAMEAAFPRAGLGSADTARVYEELLRQIPDKLALMALKDCLTRCKFPPTIAEIRSAAYLIFTNAHARPSVFEAWDEVLRQIREFGNYRTPTWSHDLIRLAVRQVGGFRYLCLSDNIIADRARFVECYDDLARRAERSDMMLPEVKALAAELSADQRRLAAGIGGRRLEPPADDTDQDGGEIIDVTDVPGGLNGLQG